MKLVCKRPAESNPKKMRPLSKLPIFLTLVDRRAVIAGGTAAAAWKAELLASAGAEVHVYAPDLSPEMADLLSHGAASGSLCHHARDWDGAAFRDAALALADVETEQQAQAFFLAAQAAGVLVNVIDKPAFCQFQFGSIVNRSPVVIGISTDGAAPILGQAIRRRIEMLLPPTLAIWAKLAKSIRAEVKTRFMPGALRRDFWESFVDRAFGPPPAKHETNVDALWGDVARNGDRRDGRITIVGAGPGDAALLTLKAVRAMHAADAILFDKSVSDEVLELARREAKRLLVGERPGQRPWQQNEINNLMAKLARQGKHVVYLRVGDPMTINCTGEAIARFSHAGIHVEVVPGVAIASGQKASHTGLSYIAEKQITSAL
jgi:uroporphyrin-III C-methyltransferase / precorrin-2 dehydrogenase / sirohydrochlorin ferrochelatase